MRVVLAGKRLGLSARGGRLCAGRCLAGSFASVLPILDVRSSLYAVRARPGGGVVVVVPSERGALLIADRLVGRR